MSYRTLAEEAVEIAQAKVDALTRELHLAEAELLTALARLDIERAR